MTKKDWILLALDKYPLDRIHVMKILFLLWYRSGRKISDYFQFIPYLYGPCSFEVYTVLESLLNEGHISQPPHQTPKWVHYYLTEKGKELAEQLTRKVSSENLTAIGLIADEVAPLSFYDLLRKVYKEAPEFAVNSIFKNFVK